MSRKTTPKLKLVKFYSILESFYFESKNCRAYSILRRGGEIKVLLATPDNIAPELSLCYIGDS